MAGSCAFYFVYTAILRLELLINLDVYDIAFNFSNIYILISGMFLAQQDLASPHDFLHETHLSPEVNETDSFSESFLLTQSHKKRRKCKRHSLEGLDLHMQPPVSLHQKSLMKDHTSKQYNR